MHPQICHEQFYLHFTDVNMGVERLSDCPGFTYNYCVIAVQYPNSMVFLLNYKETLLPSLLFFPHYS